MVGYRQNRERPQPTVRTILLDASITIIGLAISLFFLRSAIPDGMLLPVAVVGGFVVLAGYALQLKRLGK